MRACSKNWLWLSLFLIFELGYSIKYGLVRGIVVLLGFTFGMTLVLMVSSFLKGLEKDRLYGCKYYILGVTITYEYLFGKKGTARQLWAVFILVFLPVSILTTYVFPVSSQQFWLFIVPMDIIINSYGVLLAEKVDN